MQDNNKQVNIFRQTIGLLMILLLPITGMLLFLFPEPPNFFWALFVVGCPLLFLGGKLRWG